MIYIVHGGHGLPVQYAWAGFGVISFLVLMFCLLYFNTQKPLIYDFLTET